MNHKERSHLIKQVIDAAKSHAKCENLHHKKSHQHLEGWICPAESELEAAIYKVGLMLQKRDEICIALEALKNDDEEGVYWGRDQDMYNIAIDDVIQFIKGRA